jgi:hypothetical protein
LPFVNMSADDGNKFNEDLVKIGFSDLKSI